MNNNLHTLKKIKRDIKALRLFSFLLPRDQRIRIKEMDIQLSELEETIFLFNSYFSELGWCAYDSMNLTLMKDAITAYNTLGIDAGEGVLLKYYKEEVKDNIYRIKNKVEPFSMRADLIQHAFDEHFACRYYASVPLFLIIIDGAVNDFTKSKGFFAEGTDVTAWDCLVGDNEGLVKMKNIFNKCRNKTNSDEIRLPYRNGILHGRDLNYGNEYVSCKCIALMYAVADWMVMRNSEEKRKETFKKESNPPSIFESLKKHEEIVLQREEMKKWKAREVVIGKDIPLVPKKEDCTDYQYIIPIIDVFHAWKTKNYGKLSACLSNLFSYEQSEKKRAGECRQLFSTKDFCSYELKEIEERGCSLSRILVQADWEDNGKHFSEPLEFGCVYQDEDNNPVLPWHGNGKWMLIPWQVQGLYKT